MPWDKEMPESRLRELIEEVRPVALIGEAGAPRDDGLPWFTVDLEAGGREYLNLA